MPLFALPLPAGAVDLHIGSEQSFVKFETQKVRPRNMCLRLNKSARPLYKSLGPGFLCFVGLCGNWYFLFGKDANILEKKKLQIINAVNAQQWKLGTCDTKGWCNDAENSDYMSKCIQIEGIYLNASVMIIFTVFSIM